MTGIEIAGLYGGLLLVLMVVLAYNVSRNRQRTEISLGIGKDPALEQANRVHANLIENAVPGMVGLTLLALTGSSDLIVHGFGVALVLSRILHAQGLLSAPGRTFGRLVGTLLSWLSLLGMGVLLIISAF